jgi:hypothetical protein
MPRVNRKERKEQKKFSFNPKERKARKGGGAANYGVRWQSEAAAPLFHTTCEWFEAIQRLRVE